MPSWSYTLADALTTGPMMSQSPNIAPSSRQLTNTVPSNEQFSKRVPRKSQLANTMCRKRAVTRQLYQRRLTMVRSWPAPSNCGQYCSPSACAQSKMSPCAPVSSTSAAAGPVRSESAQFSSASPNPSWISESIVQSTAGDVGLISEEVVSHSSAKAKRRSSSTATSGTG